jgi:hypothetical protein
MKSYIEEKKSDEYDTLKLIVWVLIWLRLWQIILFLCYFIFAIGFIAAYILIGGHENLRHDFE